MTPTGQRVLLDAVGSAILGCGQAHAIGRLEGGSPGKGFMESLQIAANNTKALYYVKKGTQNAQNCNSAKFCGVFEILSF